MARIKQRGRRYPGGKLVPDIAPAKISRIVSLAHLRAVDPNLGTCVGWLRLRGRLSNGQMAAALKWASLIGQHDKIQGMPRRSCKSPAYELGFRGQSQDTPDDAEYVQTLKERYSGAIKALALRDYSGRLEALITDVALDNRSPAYWEHEKLETGLTILAHYFSLKV